MKSNQDKSTLLFEIAEGQQGLFTAQQAEEIGFIRTNHSYHVKTGYWAREERGIFRLVQFPRTPEQQLVTYSLWSKNREGQTLGVYSHETALSYYNLTDLNPRKLHMTVPRYFRRSRETPKLLTLHYNDLSKDEIQQAQGFSVTKPLRTVKDIIEIEMISMEFVEQAIKQSLERGLMRKTQLQDLITRVHANASTKKRLEQFLKRSSP